MKILLSVDDSIYSEAAVDVVLSLIMLFSLLLVNHAQALEASSGREVGSEAPETITKQILLDEVNLARFNLHYRLEASKQGRWKGLRYFSFQETNTSLTEAGLIVGVAERMSHIHDDQFKHLHTGALLHGNVLGGIGQTIGAYGSMQEFLINGYHSFLQSRKGFSPLQAEKHANDLVRQIDKQLADFRQIAETERSQGRSAACEVHLKEAAVLDDIRDLLVSEFDGFHSSARRTLWQQQTFYLLDTAKNVTGAVGSLFGYKAVRQHRRLFNQPAAMLVTISGAFIIINPIVGRIVGRAMGSLDGHLLARSGLKRTELTLAKLQADAAELKATCDRDKDAGEPAVVSSIKRLDLYSMHSQRLDQLLAMRTKETRAGTRIAIQNVLSGIFVGGTKLADGVEFLVAGYKYPNDPRMTNVMLGTGSIPYLVGSAYSLADSLRIQVMSEVSRYRTGKKGQLSSQLVRKQLDQLDMLEKSINTL